MFVGSMIYNPKVLQLFLNSCFCQEEFKKLSDRQNPTFAHQRLDTF